MVTPKSLGVKGRRGGGSCFSTFLLFGKHIQKGTRFIPCSEHLCIEAVDALK